MKSVLITGGTTFVSKYAAQYFVEAGYEVYVLNRNFKTQIQGVQLIEADRHQLEDVLKDKCFDVVADITAYNASDIIDLCDALGEFEQYIRLAQVLCILSMRYNHLRKRLKKRRISFGENTAQIRLRQKMLC